MLDSSLTEAQLARVIGGAAEAFIELFGKLAGRTSQPIAAIAMAGALAACTVAAGLERGAIVATLHSAFDDIESGK